MTRVKVCGVTSLADAKMCVDAGVDAIGLNFSPLSRRCVTIETAREISHALRDEVLIVGVFVDAESEVITRVRDEVGLGCVQLHGNEPPELLAMFLPHAYKALRAHGPQEILAAAARYGGDYLLVDAHVPGMMGGTATVFPWAWVSDLAKRRRLTLAGGLTPENVAEAIAVAQPWCVDVASGVESAVGVKDPAKVRAFVAAAKR